MAEALFNHLARARGESAEWYARSAGTWGMDNQAASGHAQTVMAQRGINLRAHRAKSVARADIVSADVIVVMTQNHFDVLLAQFPAYTYKLHLLSQLEQKIFDIADPYGGTLSDYETCARQLETLITTGYDQIKTWALNHDS